MKYSRPLTVVLIAALTTLSVAESKPAWTIDTFAGSGKTDRKPTTGPATEVPIGQPFGVEYGPGDAMYVTEVEHHRIWRVDRSTGHAEVIVGTGKKGYAGDGGPASKADLSEPYEVRFDKAGNIYLVERLNHIVRRVDAKTGTITTVAGTGKKGYAGDGGPATKAKLNQPHSIALDHRGGLYIADISNHRIRRVDLNTGVIETVAGNGQRKHPTDGGLAKGNPMIGPRALYIRDNTLWIALREGHSVWTLDLNTGRLKHIAGTGKKGYSGDGGPAKAGTFNGPKGIVVDNHNNAYVVDTENHAIRLIHAKTGQLTTLAGGQKGPHGDHGPATKAGMARPHGISLDPDGNIYTGDTNNHRVRVVTPAK